MNQPKQPNTSSSPLVEPPPLPSQRPAGLDFDALVTGKNLFRIGLGLVLLALGFLFRYGWQQGWITPTAQIGAGVAASVIMVVAGERMRGRRDAFGHMLQGGGVAGLYLTAFAAHQAFAMTDTTVAFAQLIAISALGVALALRRDSAILAGISVAGAFAAPFLIGGRLSEGLGDVVYLGVVMAAAVGLAYRKEWPSLYAVAALGSLTVAMLDLVVEVVGSDAGTGAPFEFAVVTYGLLGVVPVLAHVVLRQGDRLIAASSAVVAVAAGLFAGIHIDASSATTAALAAGAAALHLGFYVLSTDQTVSELQLVPSALFAIAAPAVLLEGDLTILTAAAVGAGLVLVGGRSERIPIQASGAGLYGMAALLALATSTLDAATVSNAGTIVARFGVFALAALVAIIERERGGPAEIVTGAAMAAYGGVMALTFTELAPINVGLVTAVWAALGVALVVVGNATEARAAMMVGLGTIAITLGKLFLVDLAAVEPVWRISLFAGFGLALLAVGYWISRDE